ncbi:MAG: 3-hydroxyacyl-CoA dehydrogenase NAD-binding domain-containing protein [Candidatus Acidiferrales bacterium]
MPQPTISEVAIVGAGVIGRSWAQLFIRSGCHTALHDSDVARTKAALDWIRTDLEADCSDGLIDCRELESRLKRLSIHSELSEALRRAQYVQECGPERLELKKAIFADLDRHAGSQAILCSSTSGLSMTEIAAGLRGARRCLVAHPVNPPHIIPVVELVPGKETDPAILSTVRDFLSCLGQVPVTLRSHVPGFLLNRLQAAMFREAIHLVESGVAELKDVEAVVSEGVGLRWALLGPFGVADSNADGGLRGNFSNFRQTFLDLMNDLGPASKLPPAVVDEMSNAMTAMNGGVSPAEIRRWRDRLVRKIQALKAADPHP